MNANDTDPSGGSDNLEAKCCTGYLNDGSRPLLFPFESFPKLIELREQFPEATIVRVDQAGVVRLCSYLHYTNPGFYTHLTAGGVHSSHPLCAVSEQTNIEAVIGTNVTEIRAASGRVVCPKAVKCPFGGEPQGASFNSDSRRVVTWEKRI